MAAPAACVTSYLPSCLHSHAQATTPTDLCRRNVHVRVQSVGCTMSQLRSRARAQAAAGSPRCAGEDRVFRHSHSDKRDVECKCDRHREIASVARRGQEPCPREIAPCRAAWGRQSSRVGAYLLPARASVVRHARVFLFLLFFFWRKSSSSPSGITRIMLVNRPSAVALLLVCGGAAEAFSPLALGVRAPSGYARFTRVLAPRAGRCVVPDVCSRQ